MLTNRRVDSYRTRQALQLDLAKSLVASKLPMEPWFVKIEFRKVNETGEASPPPSFEEVQTSLTGELYANT